MIGRDVVIVGGGVVGLSIAYELARAGVGSTVLDRDRLGGGASWAGAGLIPAESERTNGSPMIALRSRSARLYPEWSDALRAETGIDNGYRKTGGVDVAATPAEEAALQAMAGRWRVEGITFERLAPSDFARVEPALNPALRVAYYLADRAQVRNPRHLKALAAACLARGVILRPGVASLGFDGNHGRIDAVRTLEGAIPCGTLIIAAGAWSGGLLDGLGVRVPTPPLKGQIVLLRSDRPLLRRIVEHGKNYLVPRDDGRILIGATEDDSGFDARPTALGSESLIAEAISLCPILAEADVELTWAGLRPGSIDTRPTIGRAPEYANLIIATGHKRAGLQLSPATAEAVVNLLLDRPPRVPLDAFRPGREPARGGDETFRY